MGMGVVLQRLEEAVAQAQKQRDRAAREFHTLSEILPADSERIQAASRELCSRDSRAQLGASRPQILPSLGSELR